MCAVLFIFVCVHNQKYTRIKAVGDGFGSECERLYACLSIWFPSTSYTTIGRRIPSNRNMYDVMRNYCGDVYRSIHTETKTQAAIALYTGIYCNYEFTTHTIRIHVHNTNTFSGSAQNLLILYWYTGEYTLAALLVFQIFDAMRLCLCVMNTRMVPHLPNERVLLRVC